MTVGRRGFMGAVGAAALMPVAACAQPNEEWERRHQRQLREDWPWLGRYAADNATLKASGKATDIVFIGDSITQGWVEQRPGFFLPGRVGRGISGQTTPQMVLRMMADVIAHRPKFVHIMAGTNDIAGNTGVITVAQTCDNLAMMAMLARGAGIGVVLASVPPAAAFGWRPGVAPVGPIRAINAWSRAYAARTGATWVDYTPVLATAEGAMKPDLSRDGVHPTVAGYDAMATVLTPILKRKGLPV